RFPPACENSRRTTGWPDRPGTPKRRATAHRLRGRPTPAARVERAVGSHSSGARHLLHHVGDGRAGQALQVLRPQLEDAMRMAGRSPDFVEPEQLAVDQRHRSAHMRDRRNAADRVAGAAFDEVGIGAAEAAALPDQRGNLLLVDAPVAGSDDEHGGVIALAPEYDALGDLPDQDAQLVGGLLRRAGGVIEHDRRMRMALLPQHLGHALHAFGQCIEIGAHYPYPARLFRIAVAAREFGLRCSQSLMYLPASTSLSRSMPVSMSMPRSM